LNLIIGILFILFIFVILTPAVNADSPITPIQEKYKIIKNVGWAPWFHDSINTVEITLIDSRNSTQFEKGSKTLEVMIPNFVATSKGKVSSANDILSSDDLKIKSIQGFENTISTETRNGKSVTIIHLSENMTRFAIDIDTKEKDTVTYSGKILLKNESTLVLLDVDIVIQHNVGELLAASLTGIIVGIMVTWIIIKSYKDTWEFSSSKPMTFTVITTLVGVPSTVFVNTLFIGNTFYDILIAVSVGMLIIAGLLKKKETTSKNKLGLSFDAEKPLTENKQTLLREILDSIDKFAKTE